MCKVFSYVNHLAKTTPVSGKDIMQCTFHELHCPLATIMCQTTSCFLVAKSNIHCGDRQGQRGITLFTYRPNNKAPAIRCRIYQSDGQSRVEYLNSKYASYACQSDSDSIYPFSHGNSAHCHQRAGPLEFGGWSVPGPKARG
jgi:hypothetical protein